MKPTPEQEAFTKEVVFGTESICLEAVAGSGKTTTIMMAVQAACQAGRISSSDIMLLAFNKKIKDELEKRAPKGTTVLTLNGLGHRAWARHTGRKLYLDSKKVGGIVSALCKDSRNPERNEYLNSLWADVKDLVAKAKNEGILPSRFVSGKTLTEDKIEVWKSLALAHNLNPADDVIALARKALEQSVIEALQGKIDFDDQLYMPACFRSNFDKYKLVLVDEAQDLSEIQHFLISRCVDKSGRLISVGDPHQAIYGFRGALSNSMDLLKELYPTKEMELSYTFRCAKEATRLAQHYVPNIKAAEGNKVGTITRLGKEWSPKDIQAGAAVLCRNVAPLVKLGMECIKLGVQAYIPGKDIGAPLIKAAKNLNPVLTIYDALNEWQLNETAKAKGNLEILSRIKDTYEALCSVSEVMGVRFKDDLVVALVKLFSKTEGSIVLSTVHRAKGLEWDCVYILDSWRIPQGWVLKAIKESPDAEWMLEQEHNLYYIAVTRTKDKLIFIDYEEK